jgi:protein-S-isoprenylcysteine O-methyltransferase Ste14
MNRSTLRKDSKFFIALVLTVLLTVALVSTILEIPSAINNFLLNISPDYGAEEWPEATAMLDSLRLIGYVSFAVTLILILVGFAAKKGWLTTLGSLALYLPTFGYFAFTMFFLAGIGVLRALWFPLFDLSPNILRLGEVVYLPFFLLAWPLASVVWMAGVPVIDVYILSSYMIMALGLAIFLLGTLTWLYGKFKGFQIIGFWIYRCSRHPQYLGFLLWSYGLLILATFTPAPRGGYVPPPSLLWLISALTIVGVALHEENVMAKKHGEKYIKYCDDTPFIVPLPKRVSALIVAPLRALLRKSWPANRKEIAFTIIVYGAVLVVLSLPSVLLFHM